MLYDPKWETKNDTPLATILRRARQLIEDPHRWSPNGWGHCDKQMCGLHAACFAQSGQHYGDVSGKLNDVLRKAAGEFFGSYNDTHTHAEVLAVFDKAIAIANRR